MKTEDVIELRDENTYPDDKILGEVLGNSYGAYTKLLKLFARYEMISKWRYYKDGKAWLCKVQKKKKTIVWMSAWKGYMQATIYFPVRLLDDILALDIPEDLKEHISKTKNVGKSNPCTFFIRDPEILVDFEKVMQFKIRSR